MPANLGAALVDIGGTLWPETWPPDEERDARIGATLGSLSPSAVSDLVRRLESGASFAVASSQAAAGAPWDVGTVIAEIAEEFGCRLTDGGILTVRRAMALPAAGRIELLPNARELLATIKALGLRCAVLSNTVWRDAEIYWRDFGDFGLAGFIDAVVTSVDCGYRKPDSRAFEAAVAAVGCDAGACVMIGNSEENDIAPALTLGMRAIRVAIEEPRPVSSAAHAIAGSLHEATEILRTWVWSEGA